LSLVKYVLLLALFRNAGGRVPNFLVTCTAVTVRNTNPNPSPSTNPYPIPNTNPNHKISLIVN